MAKKIKVLENGIKEATSGYLKIEQWNKENVEEIAGYYRRILGLLGKIQAVKGC